MSKVKLIVKSYHTLDAGRMTSTQIDLPESMEIVGVVRTDFEPDASGAVRTSDDLAAVIDVDDMNNIVGKVLTLIDATFTDKEQRQAMKDIFKAELWNWHTALIDRLVPAWKDPRFTDADSAKQ